MSTQLAVIENKVQSVVVPKPKRAEIIAALVAVAKQDYAAKAKERAEKIEALAQTYRKHLTTDLRKKGVAASIAARTSIHEYEGCGRVYCSLLPEHTSEATEAAFEAWKTEVKTRMASWDESAIKREITRKLDGMAPSSERIATLASSKEIAALYEHLTAPAPVANV